jgi:hypothetical protein
MGRAQHHLLLSKGCVAGLSPRPASCCQLCTVCLVEATVLAKWHSYVDVCGRIPEPSETLWLHFYADCKQPHSGEATHHQRHHMGLGDLLKVPKQPVQGPRDHWVRRPSRVRKLVSTRLSAHGVGLACACLAVCQDLAEQRAACVLKIQLAPTGGGPWGMCHQSLIMCQAGLCQAIMNLQ